MTLINYIQFNLYILYFIKVYCTILFLYLYYIINNTIQIYYKI